MCISLFFSKTLHWQYQISACCKIYRKEFIHNKSLFFIEDTMYEDNDFSIRAAAAATKCRHFDIAPYIYRQVATSTTHDVVSVSRLVYWQKTWPIITSLLNTIGKQDPRFKELINTYMRYDLWDVLNNLYKLPKEQRPIIKNNLSISEWLHYIHFLPLKRRVEYIRKLIKA